MNLAYKFGVQGPGSIYQMTRNALVPGPTSGLSANESNVTTVEGGPEVLAVVLGVFAAVLVVRGAMGYYIGKQFKRPVAGAITGGLFGAPGLGVTALFGKGK